MQTDINWVPNHTANSKFAAIGAKYNSPEYKIISYLAQTAIFFTCHKTVNLGDFSLNDIVNMIFVITFLAFASVQARKNVLLDSTTDPSSGWLLYSRTLQALTIEGWKAVQDKKNLTSYEVCDRQISSEVKVSNWLWTPFIERGGAISILIEIEYDIRECYASDDYGNCEEGFVLFLYQSDQ